MSDNLLDVVIEGSLVVQLTQSLKTGGADWCVVGGWGVDALLHDQTREHRDLDVFVARDQLGNVLELMHRVGFRRANAWAESRVLADDGPCAGHDSAFVMADGEGREVDIHVYAVHGDCLEALWETPHTFRPNDLEARGVIGGTVVRCLTLEKQLETHTGYQLPAEHRRDVRRLQRLLTRL